LDKNTVKNILNKLEITVTTAVSESGKLSDAIKESIIE
jgi:hypothetical protein